MASRAGLRFSPYFARASRSTLRQPFGRRYQTTDAAAAPSESTLSRIWNSPVGVKTWAIVLAGASDFARPAEKLSLTQTVALTTTGLIWTRWCFVIKPKNMLLAAVNFLLAGVGITQLTRIYMYQKSLENGSLAQVAEKDAQEVVGVAKDVTKDPQGAAERAGIK
ncbi:MAG: hypothetical protein Q9191_006823 [Dirinaria sp. TL-2023a]